MSTPIPQVSKNRPGHYGDTDKGAGTGRKNGRSYNKGMRRYLFVFLGLVLWSGLRANAQAFDLAGPKVDVHVKRGDVTLPIGEVPNLQVNDRLWIHPDFPESQSARYILIVAFLRGATNPPPPEWFTKVETWNKQIRDEGVFVTVPQEAQQAIVFLAPETGGDFNTLRNAVRGRPGTFVQCYAGSADGELGSDASRHLSFRSEGHFAK